jgi:hypothetical protein
MRTIATIALLALLAACQPERQTFQPGPTASAGGSTAPSTAAPPPEEPAPSPTPDPGPDPAATPDPAPTPAETPDPAPTPTPAPPARVQLLDATVSGVPVPGDYEQLLRESTVDPMNQILGCYQERITAAAVPGGDLRLQLYISARQVIRATPESTLPDEPMQECVLARLREVRLPDSTPTAGVRVRLVLRFDRGDIEDRTVRVLAEASGPVS